MRSHIIIRLRCSEVGCCRYWYGLYSGGLGLGGLGGGGCFGGVHFGRFSRGDPAEEFPNGILDINYFLVFQISECQCG